MSNFCLQNETTLVSFLTPVGIAFNSTNTQERVCKIKDVVTIPQGKLPSCHIWNQFFWFAFDTNSSRPLWHGFCKLTALCGKTEQTVDSFKKPVSHLPLVKPLKYALTCTSRLKISSLISERFVYVKYKLPKNIYIWSYSRRTDSINGRKNRTVSSFLTAFEGQVAQRSRNILMWLLIAVILDILQKDEVFQLRTL